MVFQCPECGTRYQLTEEKMSGKGRRVRCARCRATFFAAAEGATAPEMQPEVAATDHLEGFDPDAASETGSETRSVEDAFDFDSIPPLGDESPETERPLSEDDGYDDGFVTELSDDDEIAAEENGEQPLAEKQGGDDEATVSDEQNVTSTEERSSMSTLSRLLLVLLLVLVAGTIYLMVTDGVEAPMELINSLLNP